jgi:hypothetical protein
VDEHCPIRLPGDTALLDYEPATGYVHFQPLNTHTVSLLRLVEGAVTVADEAQSMTPGDPR